MITPKSDIVKDRYINNRNDNGASDTDVQSSPHSDTVASIAESFHDLELGDQGISNPVTKTNTSNRPAATVCTHANECTHPPARAQYVENVREVLVYSAAHGYQYVPVPQAQEMQRRLKNSEKVCIVGKMDAGAKPSIVIETNNSSDDDEGTIRSVSGDQDGVGAVVDTAKISTTHSTHTPSLYKYTQKMVEQCLGVTQYMNESILPTQTQRSIVQQTTDFGILSNSVPQFSPLDQVGTASHAVLSSSDSDDSNAAPPVPTIHNTDPLHCGTVNASNHLLTGVESDRSGGTTTTVLHRFKVCGDGGASASASASWGEGDDGADKSSNSTVNLLTPGQINIT
uniref:Uncharacterized protein n=2 Tax=Lygus hesperus TaxID=30085 RepID=A0A146M2V6_LYGHE